MAVAWRREGRPNLETKPWNVLTVQVADLQRKYLVKGVFEEDGYHVMLSDTCSLWEESIHTEKIVKRLKTLNPSVEAPLTVLNAALSSHLDSQNNTANYSITTPTPSRNADGPAANSSDKIVLSIQTTLSSLPLEWQFICTKCAPDKLSTHLVLPLLSMVGELGRRQQHLTQLLNKKDKELQDFNEQGYTVTRNGQKIAKKLATQVTKETNSVKSLVYEYNALTRAGGESSEIGITEALDPHNIEGQITEFSSVCNTVASGRKRQIMDAYLSLCRSKEEVSLLKNECCNICRYYHQRQKSILSNYAYEVNESYNRGAQALLYRLLQETNNFIKQAEELQQIISSNNKDSLTVSYDSDVSSSDSDDDCY